MLLITFCNQTGARRPFGLAAVEPESGRFRWIGLGSWRKAAGATGLAFHEGFLYVVVQSKKTPRLAAFDRATWRLAAVTPFSRARDPHSLAAGRDGLYVASSGDNAVYRLTLNGGAVSSEELFWRYSGASQNCDDVHVNSLTFAGDRLLVTGFGPRTENGSWGSDGFVMDAGSGTRLASGLGQPHSLAVDGTRIAVAESYAACCAERGAGRVFLGTLTASGISFSKSVEVPGYPRGLSFDGDTLLIGSSATRRVSRSTNATLVHERPGCGQSRLFRLNIGSLTLKPLFNCTRHGREIYAITRLDGPSPPASAALPLWKKLTAKLIRRAT